MNERNIEKRTTNSGAMRVLVPTSVNVKEIIRTAELSPTRSKTLKNKMYYFLSKIVSTNDNLKLNEDNNGYRNISSVIMRKIMGRKDYYLVLELLMGCNDPIIESDNSWQKSPSEKIKGFCKGYRLTEKYNTGEVEYKTIPYKTHKRIIKHIPEEKERKLLEIKYQFLLNQFKEHTLDIDPMVFDYLRKFGNKLLSRVKNQNEYQTKMIYNLIGRWLYNVEKIQKHDYWRQVSPANHRLNSIFTSFNETMRPFLLCDGKPLYGVDITSSQPYLLSSVMSNRFFTDCDNGFNLKSIYPEVYNELVSKGCILASSTSTSLRNMEFGPVDSSGSGFSVFSSSASSSSVNGSAGFSHVSSPFMWGQFFDEKDIESITTYQNSPFDNDFYKNLTLSCQSMNGKVVVSYEKQRQRFKDNMMLVLFDQHRHHRNSIEEIKSFKMIFPGVNKWIEMMFDLIGNSRLSYLLQRTESYMVLDVVCREFHEKYPSRPIFTIHDAIYTYEEYLPDLQSLILGRFYDITGVRVGVKKKDERVNQEPKSKDIEKKWQNIKSIKTLEAYEKGKHRVFNSNVKRGKEFLKMSPLNN